MIFSKTRMSTLEKPSRIRCLWCKKVSTHKDWREIDGMITSTRECDSCANLETEFLLERQAGQQSEHKHDPEDCELSDCK